MPHQAFLLVYTMLTSTRQTGRLPVTGIALAKQGEVSHLPSSIPAARMLAHWAPVVLRALYEHDVRRQYCPSSLWLEPFNATEAVQEGHFCAGAVARALSQGHSQLNAPLYVPTFHLFNDSWQTIECRLMICWCA